MCPSGRSLESGGLQEEGAPPSYRHPSRASTPLLTTHDPSSHPARPCHTHHHHHPLATATTHYPPSTHTPDRSTLIHS